MWTYGYLLRRICEVADDYGIAIVYLMKHIHHRNAPMCGGGCGKRVKRRLLECARLNKAFNADLWRHTTYL